MTRVNFLLPEVKTYPESRPTRCPYCHSSLLQRYGTLIKRVRDLHTSQVTAHRYFCSCCRRTFRHYPKGVDSHDQSQRLRALAALLWALGLSHGNTSQVLTALGGGIAKMTSWRDVQEMGRSLRRRPPAQGTIEVIGADETVVKVRGQRMVVGFVTEPNSGELLGLDLLLEQDSHAFLHWLRGYVEELGVKVVVSDDLSTYKPVVEELGIEQQVCLAHVRKNGTRRLKQIAGYEREKEKLKALLKELPEGGGEELLALEREVAGEAKLKDLVVDLSQRWRSLVCHKKQKGVPMTNNRTEQVIGRSKVRYKTMRGFKSREGMLNGLRVTQWVWNPGRPPDMECLLAA